MVRRKDISEQHWQAVRSAQNYAAKGFHAAIHLEEEIRREALVKEWSAFLRFLRLAALESGGMLIITHHSCSYIPCCRSWLSSIWRNVVKRLFL
jgi:diacylglycerol kinase